jgi:hypothetical protein
VIARKQKHYFESRTSQLHIKPPSSFAALYFADDSREHCQYGDKITANVFSFINVNSINPLLFQQPLVGHILLQKYPTSVISKSFVKAGTFKTILRFLT